jgi:hypothetical protein
MCNNIHLPWQRISALLHIIKEEKAKQSSIESILSIEGIIGMVHEGYYCVSNFGKPSRRVLTTCSDCELSIDFLGSSLNLIDDPLKSSLYFWSSFQCSFFLSLSPKMVHVLLYF